MINRCIKEFLDKIHTKVTPSNNNEKEPSEKEIISIKLPFLGRQSYKMKKELRKFIKLNIPGIKFRIIFTTPKQISNFFSFKDKIPKSLQSHLVYKIKCEECNLFYYGLAERHLRVRACDHLGLSILTGKPIKGVDTSMKSHWRENKHQIKWDSFEIIAREEDGFKLRIKESLLINRDKPVLNNNLYSTPLHLF